MIIRKVRLEELFKINEFWWELISEQDFYDSRIVRSDLNNHRSSNFLREKIIKNSFFLVEDESQVIIAIGSLSQELHFLETSKNIWNIADIWVKKEYRRKGVATSLINFLEKIAESEGAEEIRLTVYSENTSAGHLYKSLGYNEIISTLSKTL